jgi:hypothetical protein
MCKKPSARPPEGPLLPTEVAEELTALIPFPEDFTFPFLRQPLEVRRLIYAFLFKASVPLYPTVETHPDTDRVRERYLYPKPTFATALLRVNRQIHDEATAVLWGSNQIVLQFPLDWNEAVAQSAGVCRCRLGCRQKVPWFVRRATFIPRVEHLSKIHNLVIEAHLFRKPGVDQAADRPALPASKVHKQLAEFSEMLGTEHSVRRCEMRFAAVLTRDNPNEAQVRFNRAKHFSEAPGRRGKCCVFSAHSAFGRSNLNMVDLEGLCRMSMEADQQVLQPLTRLREIGNVKVVGRVTEEWAEFMKTCMEGKLGTTVDESIFRPQRKVMKVPALKEKKPSSKTKPSAAESKAKRAVPSARRYVPGSYPHSAQEL